jgi:hypothetical protein
MNFFSNVLRAFRPGQDATGDLRPFLSQPEIRTLLARKQPSDEDFLRAEMLEIFDTSTQHTWLMATNMALYCIVDNRRQPHARRLWRIPREDIVTDREITLQISEVALTDRDSYVIINGKRPRKFNRALFQTLSIKESIEMMLVSAFKL